MNKKNIFIAAAFVFGIGFSGFGQEGHVQVSQDSLIPQLLDLKTEMGKESRIGDRYRIQIFSGDNKKASDAIKEFRSLNSDWPSTIVYETPNYKVWIGNFRNSLEADRALLEIKQSFPAAFRFKPDRK
ncbi:sporulation protein [Salinimicrobium marinum]|uniref:Sporulation protein n=1 Tax=Salinimicrobium marinum TaxID=680283 RepID=A0A918S7B9_9FLAO|nr:SPOR domain-containing protein [Salinimicrobium marinum]GHA24194.1 sporulation protein [Salinimicrobium marinum]